MSVDTVFFYLVATWYVIEAISALSLIAVAVTFIIYPPSKNKERKHD